MFTKEAILSASVYSKQNNCKGDLTNQEALEHAQVSGKLNIVVNAVFGGSFFFTDDCCIGADLFPKNYIGCSVPFPMKVAQRSYLPDGIIDTPEKYISVFEEDRKQITTMEQLVQLLNHPLYDQLPD